MEATIDRCAACAVRPLCATAAQAPTYVVGKQLVDVCAAAVLLLALAPVAAVLAVAIRWDSKGPVLFRQRRIGYRCKPFEMIKFRTMFADRRSQSGVSPAQSERRRTHKSPSDPRVTRVGRLLRRSCLDELPQLWNVLRGEMSLIGPRPELPEIVAGYAAWQYARHAVVPGISGWWQVNRDQNRRMHETTEMDIYYMQHRSLRLDLMILFRTVAIVFRGTGAF